MLRPGRKGHHDRFFDLASIIGVWDRLMCHHSQGSRNRFIGGHKMKIQDRRKKILYLLAVGTIVVTLITAFDFPAQAKDKSGVLRASELIGMTVLGNDGKKLGDIKDLVIYPEEGGIQYAVLDFGGFAGIGDKYFAVPWEALELDRMNKKVSLDVHKKDLKNAPGFDKKNWPDLNLSQVMIYEFYEVPQPDQEIRLRSKR